MSRERVKMETNKDPSDLLHQSNQGNEKEDFLFETYLDDAYSADIVSTYFSWPNIYLYLYL